MKLQDRMNQLVTQLGLNYRVKWLPDPQAENHASIKNGFIILHDVDEGEAWISLTHELLELKIRPLLSYYRELVNVLIGFIEKHAYREKERLLERLPDDVILIMKEVERHGKS